MTERDYTSAASPPASRARSSFTFATWLFLRLLAVIHLIAFVSFWVQFEGLVGADGLLPAARYFAAARDQLGPAAYHQLPSLCWIFGAGKFLHLLCAVGVVLSFLLFAGIAPAICLFLLWAGYLSVCSAGQIFFNFQWDTLLLETSLLAVFIAPWSWLPLWRAHEPPRLARLLVWWLIFRLMFLAGVVKLASGDTSWRDLTALTFHYETQPLPTPLGWFAQQAPAWWHRASCAGMFVLELLAPFLLFAPRPLRHNAALLLAAFMAAVALTGNYTYFNFLAIALCLFCLDDAWWRHVLPRALSRYFRLSRDVPPTECNLLGYTSAGGIQRVARVVFAVVVVAITLPQTLAVVVRGMPAPPGFAVVSRAVGPLRSFNNYGLFAVMTRTRPELIFEGSHDGRDWHAYEFPHKPGALRRAPTWVAPHQPRLDWQLWFAALGSPQQNPWVLALCEHLLRGTPDVLTLLEHNPFAAKPPRHIRVIRYEYHFTDAATRGRTDQWWRRTPLDVYVGPASLRE